MNANDVIECYVHDVARQLPRRQRNDVAFELRALLQEELQAEVEASGRPADAAMATERVRAFGRPSEVAARYRPPLVVIDPADGQRFVRATLIGLVVIWTLGLIARLRQPMVAGTDALTALGHWWAGTVVASLWWPGLLVTGFALAAWARRRQPSGGTWKPRSLHRSEGGRLGLAMAVIGMASGIGILIDPRWLLDVAFHGTAAPQAYAALTYTDTFLHRQAGLVLMLVALNIPLYLAVLVKGHWSPRLRQAERALGLATCAALVWTVLDGPVFMTAASDSATKGFLVLTIVATLIGMGVRWYRDVRPMPGRQAHP